MPTSTVFLDTNVFLYAIGAPHSLKAASQRVLERVGEGGAGRGHQHGGRSGDSCTSSFGRGSRETGLKLARPAIGFLGGLLPVTQADISTACDLIDRYPALPTRDAIHAATMLNNGIFEIVTADGHFDEVQGIRRFPLAESTS